MKKLLLGFVLGILSIMLFNDVVDIAYYHAKGDSKIMLQRIKNESNTRI